MIFLFGTLRQGKGELARFKVLKNLYSFSAVRFGGWSKFGELLDELGKQGQRIDAGRSHYKEIVISDCLAVASSEYPSRQVAAWQPSIVAMPRCVCGDWLPPQHTCSHALADVNTKRR